MSKWVIQLMALFALSMLTNGCTGFVVKVRDAVDEQEALAAKKDHDDMLAVVTQREREAWKSQRPLKSGELIPGLFAQAQLQDTWKGNACKNNRIVEIKMTTGRREPMVAEGSSPIVNVRGAFTASEESKQPTRRAIEAGLEGKFDRNTGFLGMRAIPKSTDPTPEEIEEDRRIRSHVANQIFVISQQLNSRPSESEKYNLMGEKQKLQSDENERLKTLAENAAARAAAAKAELVPFNVDIARDIEGTGWAGIIEGADFQDCTLVLVSDHGLSTAKLPPITGQMALIRAQTQTSNGYWLNLAAKDAREEDFFLLGQLYERQGERSPDNYVRAFEYYRSVNDKKEDARAQAALSRMYAKGLGTQVNALEAQRLNNLAAATLKKASLVCESPKTLEAIGQMAERARAKGRIFEILVETFPGMDIKTLDSRVVKRMVANVVSMDKPFDCIIWSQRIDPQINADPTPDAYEWRDQYGQYHHTEDNRFNTALKGALGSMVEAAGKKVPVHNIITVEPVGRLRYKLTWSDGVHSRVRNCRFRITQRWLLLFGQNIPVLQWRLAVFCRRGGRRVGRVQLVSFVQPKTL